MKSLFAFITIALVAFTGVVEAKPLPAAAQKALSDALAKVDKTDQAAVNQAVLGVAAAFPGLAADITGAAVASLSASLSPAAAANVIPAMVAQVAKAYPAVAGAIVSAAITSLPASLKAEIAPKVVTQSINAVPGTEAKTAIVNSAIQAVSGDSALVATITQIATDNNLEVNSELAQGPPPAEAADDGGETQPISPTNVGTAVPPPTSSGGSGQPSS